MKIILSTKSTNPISTTNILATLCLSVAMLLFPLTTLQASTTWTAVGTAGFSAGYAAYESLAIDSNDTLYVAYGDWGNSYKATVMTYAGSAWSSVGSPGFANDYGPGFLSHLSLAIDSNDTLYLAYADGVNNNEATVMTYTGATWSVVGTADFSDDDVSDVDLAIDSNDTLYVAYRDNFEGSNKATVMTYTGMAWIPLGTVRFSAGGANQLAMALSPSDVPYVVFSDGTNSSKATVMTYTDATWSVLGTAGFSAGRVAYSDITTDSNGVPYVVYRDVANSNKATVMAYIDSTWSVVGTVGFSAGAVLEPTIMFDSNDTLYVAYRDVANSEKATVMTYTDSTWSVVGMAGFSAAGIQSPSLAFTSDNNAYLAYQDVGNGNKTTVMSYLLYGQEGSGSGGLNYTHPPLCTVRFTPDTVTQGQQTILSWTHTWPTYRKDIFYVRVPGKQGGLYSSQVSSVAITPQHTTTYRIAMFNLWGATFCEDTVTVVDEGGNEIQPLKPQNKMLTAGASNSPALQVIRNFFLWLLVR